MMNLLLLLALAQLGSPKPTPQAAKAGQGRPAEYEVVVRKDVRVPMRDGVTLATDLYLPKAEGKWPAILTRTPYGKNGQRGNGTYFAARGYVFIAQDCRGRFGSGGTWGGFVKDDRKDGFDVARWIAAQPWSDGKFGMIGTSYVGGTQHAMAMGKPPALVTAIPVDAVSNMGYQSMRNAGAFELRFWNWIMSTAPRGVNADPPTKKMLQEMTDNRLHYLRNLPLRRGTTPLKHMPEYEEWLVEAMKHGANDEFWAHVNILDHAEDYKDIPLYLVGGWYDSWGGNTTANYRALSKTKKGPIYLIMGPWIHGRQGNTSHGQVSFGKDAAIKDPRGWRLDWTDRWLKGRDDRVGKVDPFKTNVRIFVMGTGSGRKTEKGLLDHGGYWRSVTAWPPAERKDTKYYLRKGGLLSPEAPSSETASTKYVFDPANPVPTIGGNISSNRGIMLQGAWDQRGGPHVWNAQEPIPLSSRNDILVFMTPPLKEDVEVTGELEVKLWVSSSAPDTDFTAKLVDVAPPNPDFPGGFDMNIADGIVRARFRESLKAEKFMQPGEIYPVTIRMYPSSNVFRKGHRIRVDVSSSNFPRFDLNPNTGEPLNDNRRWAKATNTIHQSAKHPSHIVLPILPKTK